MDRVFKFMIYEEEKNMERHQYDKSTAVNLNKILESSSKNYEWFKFKLNLILLINFNKTIEIRRIQIDGFNDADFIKLVLLH